MSRRRLWPKHAVPVSAESVERLRVILAEYGGESRRERERSHPSKVRAVDPTSNPDCVGSR